MVTGDADREGVEPRKLNLVSADGIDPSAGENPRSARASSEGTPGVRGRVEPEIANMR
jgi:hypothetical protein